MTDSSDNTPEITLFFSIGIIGMDENVTEYITVPITDDEVFQKQLAMKAQLAQLKLQTGFLELMMTQFPQWALDKFGDNLPDSFKG